jgi:hypothetical protein
MQLTLVHTPKDIIPSLKSVCRLLSENEPMFVNVVPPSWALPNKCAFNAKRYVEEHGGEVIFGWAITMWDKVLLDCIGHAVVRHDDEFIDVTPNKYNDKKLLFVQDDEMVFDYSDEMSRMPSMNIAISSSKEVKRLVNIENEIYSIKTKYPVTSGSIALTPDDRKQISILENEKQRIVPKIIMDHTHHNGPCICGSGRKFRKCCQKAF